MSLINEINRRVEARRNKLIRHCLALISCTPTYVGDLSGQRAAQRYIRQQIRRLGGLVVDIPARRSLFRNPLYVNVRDWSSDFEDYEPVGASVVVGRWGSASSSRTLALAGHIDVEPVDVSEWSDAESASGKQIGHHILGRGAADMLAAFAAYFVALDVAAKLGGPAINVELHSVPDEELGGNGTLALLSSAHEAPDYVVIGEPTGCRIAEATLGFHHFVIGVDGDRRHMAAADSSRSSIEVAADAIRALRKARPRIAELISAAPGFANYASSPLAFGKVRGGTDAAVPPVRCDVEGVAFSPPGMEPHELLAILRAAISDGGLDPSSIRLTGMSFPGNSPNVDRRLAIAASTSLDGFAGTSSFCGFPSPCDLRLYEAHGTAGIVFGPGDLGFAHAPDEQVDLDSLSEYAKAIAHLLLTFRP